MMNQLLVKPANAHQVHRITPVSAGWKYVGFELYDLQTGQRQVLRQAGRELCLVVLSGTASVKAGEKLWNGVGGRGAVFDEQAPGVVYVPAGGRVEVRADTSVELAVCSALGEGNSGAARMVDGSEMSREVRGQDTNTRYVRNILPENQPVDSLLVVEVITPSGYWSSYPLHKHDRDALPEESKLEETYYHRLNPATGYVHQRVYTDDRSLDETLSAEDRDVVLVPEGYHPVGCHMDIPVTILMSWRGRFVNGILSMTRRMNGF